MNVVIDTNVIVSAFLSSRGKPAAILEMFFNDEIKIYYNENILNEYEDVLSRPVLHIEQEKAKKLFNILRVTGLSIETVVSDIPLPDEDDRIFYDTAKLSGAILITGNIKHYPVENFIKPPSEFLDMLI